MRPALAVQTFGSVLVTGSFALAELAARLLEASPGSGLAWHLNLGPFRPFEQARAGACPLAALLGPHTLVLALALLGLALLAHRTGHRLGVAVVANLSFAASAGLAQAWLTAEAVGHHASVSPAALLDRCGEATCLVAAMLAASGLACAASHAGFALAIWRDGREGPVQSPETAGLAWA